MHSAFCTAQHQEATTAMAALPWFNPPMNMRACATAFMLTTWPRYCEKKNSTNDRRENKQMKRHILFTAANTFKYLGQSATLSGCLNDSSENRQDAMTVWRKSGWDINSFDLRESNNTAEIVRDRLEKIVANMNATDDIDILWLNNSSHGTHFKDRVTGQTVSCTVCYDSTWDKPASFVSKLDYKRAFDKLKPQKRVFALFDSCESGNMGESFRLMEDFTKLNRWIEPPSDVHRDLTETIEVRFPKQCWTIAGCEENGTCADVHDEHPHGLFNRTRIQTTTAQPALKLSALAALINKKMSGQKCVPNGPEWSFLQEN